LGFAIPSIILIVGIIIFQVRKRQNCPEKETKKEEPNEVVEVGDTSSAQPQEKKQMAFP